MQTKTFANYTFACEFLKKHYNWFSHQANAYLYKNSYRTHRGGEVSVRLPLWTMRNKLTVAYTKLVDQLRKTNQTDLMDAERSSIIIDNLIEEYSLNDEQLTDDEMQYLMDGISLYVRVVTA